MGNVIRASPPALAEGTLMSWKRLARPGVERLSPGVVMGSNGNGMVRLPAASSCPCPEERRVLRTEGESMEEGRLVCMERKRSRQ